MRFRDLFGDIGKITEDLEYMIGRTASRIERTIQTKLDRMTRRLGYAVMSIVFLLLSAGFIIAGAIIFFNRYFALDYILLVAGAILLYGALMFKLAK